MKFEHISLSIGIIIYFLVFANESIAGTFKFKCGNYLRYFEWFEMQLSISIALNQLLRAVKVIKC